MPNHFRNNGRLPADKSIGLDSLEDFNLPIIVCVVCGGRYSIADVTILDITWKTLVCVDCQTKALQDPDSCFGKRFDPGLNCCSSFCPDRVMCAMHKNGQFVKVKELSEQGRAIALELLAPPPKPKKRKYAHPFPLRNSLIRICWDLCLSGTTMHRLEREVRRARGNFDLIIKEFRKEKRDRFTWTFVEKAGGVVQIVWTL